MSSLPSWATVDPNKISGQHPGQGFNLVHGEWVKGAKNEPIVDPMNGEVFLNMPATQSSELEPFVTSMRSCPKHGLHNPLKAVER